MRKKYGKKPPRPSSAILEKKPAKLVESLSRTKNKAVISQQRMIVKNCTVGVRGLVEKFLSKKRWRSLIFRLRHCLNLAICNPASMNLFRMQYYLSIKFLDVIQHILTSTLEGTGRFHFQGYQRRAVLQGILDIRPLALGDVPGEGGIAPSRAA